MRSFYLLISSIMIFFLGEALFAGERTSQYKIPATEEMIAHETRNREEFRELEPTYYGPGFSKLRRPLKLGRKLIDSSEAHEELLKVYQRIEWGQKHNDRINVCTKENIKALMKIIDDYPDSSQAVTTKYVLAYLLINGIWSGSLENKYWGWDLCRELYLQFPDQWQGKMALFRFYEFFYYPSTGMYDTAWSANYLDDYERIAWEVEALYIEKEKYPQMLELRKPKLGISSGYWDHPRDAFCQIARSGFNEKTLSAEAYDRVYFIYRHIYKLCLEGKFCPVDEVVWEHRRTQKGDSYCFPADLRDKPWPAPAPPAPPTPPPKK